MKKYVRAYAPATVANVSCAFDILGLAVNNPGDEVSITLTDESQIKIESITGDNGRLPLDPNKNTATVAIQAFLKHIKTDLGINVQIDKHMPLGSGMGSSAASAAAALVAINALLDNPLTKKELLEFAIKSEGIACGSEHADNVAPALLGGFVLIRSYSPLDIIQIPTPKDLFCTIIHPHLELNTIDSRLILKEEIPLKTAVKQWGNIAGLISGLYTSDYQLIARSLTDHIFEPTRSFVIPGFSTIKQAALNAGALGCSISGSGPSLFALSTNSNIANQIAKDMQKEFASINIDSQTFVSPINTIGAHVLEAY